MFSRSQSLHENRSLLLVFLLGFVVFASFLLTEHRLASRLELPPPPGDSVDYDHLGFSLWKGKGFTFDYLDEEWREPYLQYPVYRSVLKRQSDSTPTGYRPPLLPALLSFHYSLFGRDFFVWRILMLGLGASLVALLAAFAYRGGGVLSAGLAVFLLSWESELQKVWLQGFTTEGLTALLLLLLFTTFALSRDILAGVCLGLLILLRTSFGLFALVFLLTALLYERGIKPFRDRVQRSCFVGLVALAVFSPWLIRNVFVLGPTYPLGTQGAINLPAGYSDHAMERYGVWDSRQLRSLHSPDQALPQGREKELRKAKRGKHLALEWVVENPLSTMQLFLQKVYSFLWRDALTYQRILLALALSGTIFCLSHPLVPLLWSFLFAQSVVVELTWNVSGGRFLLPFVPILIGFISILGWKMAHSSYTKLPSQSS